MRDRDLYIVALIAILLDAICATCVVVTPLGLLWLKEVH
jgi:hypothetical protein